MSQLAFYTGRCEAWISAMLAAASLNEKTIAAIKVSVAKATDTTGKTPEEIAELPFQYIGIMVSWLESLEEVVPPEEKVKIINLLAEINATDIIKTNKKR